MSVFGDGIDPGLSYFGREWKHAAKDLAERSEIILRDPLAKVHQALVQYRLGVEHLQKLFSFNGRLAVMQSGHHAGLALVAERNQHSPTHWRRHTGQSVREHHVQWDGQSHVAK